jgi:hypothetical protein
MQLKPDIIGMVVVITGGMVYLTWLFLVVGMTLRP